MDKHIYYTVAEVAEHFKLYHKTGAHAGELNTKAVYALPIRKSKLQGVGVRYLGQDILDYERLMRNRGLLRGVA